MSAGPAAQAAPVAPLNPQQLRGLGVMRVLYFIFFASIGAYFPYVNVYLREIGLSGTQIGTINTLAPLVGIFAATLWGMLNDRLGNPRLILLLAAPGSAVAAVLLSSTQSFLWLVAFAGLLALFNSAIIPLMDNTTLRLLGERRTDYGRYRVAGSLGFILVALGTGFLFERTGLHWLFYVFAALMGVFAVAALALPAERVRLSGSLWGGLRQMVRQPAWLIFAISAMLLWVANNGTMNFVGITIKGMGGSDRLVGLASTVAAATEIPILLLGGRLMHRFGHTRLLVAAFVLFSLRSALLAVMPRPEWAVAINLLSGLAFASFWLSAVAYANEAAPENLKSTAQGLLFSLLNIASMGGAISSGWLYDQVGAQPMFWGMMGFSLTGLLIFVFGRQRFLKH